MTISQPTSSSKTDTASKQVTASDGVPYVLRTRIFQDRDVERVKKVFISGVCDGPGSALQGAYREHLTSYVALFAYSLASLGVAIIAVPPLLPFLATIMGRFSPLPMRDCGEHPCAIGIGLILAGICALGGSLLYIRKQFMVYVESCLRGDLSDIPGRYGLTPADSNAATETSTASSSSSLPSTGKLNGEPMLVANGVSAFWVTEARRADSDEWEVVGSVGLSDNPTDTIPRSTTLYRMMVSPHHRKMGIARALLDVLVDHARAHGVQNITLTTTEFQHAAQKLYAKLGWEVFKRTAVPLGWMSITLLHFRKDLVKMS